MKYEIVIDPQAEERVVIYAKSHDERVKRIERLLLEEREDVVGYLGDSIIPLDIRTVSAFRSEDGGVYAVKDGRRIPVKERLYAIEERLGASYIRISQSCIANIGMIARFEATFGGSLAVIFKDGYRDYVSRRQLKSVKERIGFR